MKPYGIAIFFSGVERTLVGSKFNMRVDELKSAAYALKNFAIDDGCEEELLVPYGRFSDARLRDVPRAVFERYKGKLPSYWRMRAEHFYTEFARVEAGAEAWRRGDIETFGRLSTESGYSSIYNYETGSDELKALYEAMTHTDGVYGGRFSGAGFKGCCMALIDPAFREKIEERVSAEYLKAFPALKGKYSVHFCHSADGVSLGTGGVSLGGKDTGIGGDGTDVDKEGTAI
jgi:galactokinase/galacturonokinase